MSSLYTAAVRYLPSGKTRLEDAKLVGVCKFVDVPRKGDSVALSLAMISKISEIEIAESRDTVSSIYLPVWEVAFDPVDRQVTSDPLQEIVGFTVFLSDAERTM